MQYDLRKRMFNHLQELSFSYFSRTPVGWIMSRVTSDSERIAQLVTWGMVDVTWAVFNIVTAMIFMLWINWQLALIVLAIIPILFWVAVQFKKRILVQFRVVRKINSKITGEYNQNITGVRVVKALGREDANLADFTGLTNEMYGASYRAAWLSALFLPAVQLISSFAVGAVVLYAGLGAGVGGMTIGAIAAFFGYITFMLWPIQDLARVYSELQNAIASAERVFSLVDAQPDIADQDAAFDPGTIRGDIEFDHVDFYYEADKPVLTDFSLKVQRGETIALVGPTGGGKSTIVNLVCRFYEPKTGVLRIGGHDYRDYTLHSIHSRIGVVLQTPHLFSGSVRENIRYGRLDATDAEVEKAAQVAGAHEFIAALDGGYGAEVGEGGGRLSVGPEAAHQPGARGAGEPRGAGDGRGDQLGGHRHRGADPAGHGAGDGRADELRHRAPAEHHQARQPHPGGRERADRRAGHPRRAAARAWALLQAVHAAVPPGARGGVRRDRAG